MRAVPLVLLALAVAGVMAVGPAVGAPEQTPKRGGTLVIGTVTQGEPSCLNVFLPRCNVPSPGGAGPPGRLQDLAGRDLAAEPRLGRRDRQEAARHDRLPHTSGGSLERRGAGHRPGLRVHAPGAPRAPPRERVTSQRPSRACRRREDGRGRAARALGRLAAALRPSSCRGTWPPARTSRVSGRTGSTTRGRGGRSAAGHSSSRAGSAAGS